MYFMLIPCFFLDVIFKAEIFFKFLWALILEAVKLLLILKGYRFFAIRVLQKSEIRLNF